MAARQEELDKGYQSYQKRGGDIQRRIYIVEHPGGQPTVEYEFRPNNKGLFINDKIMQPSHFLPATGFQTAPLLTA